MECHDECRAESERNEIQLLDILVLHLKESSTMKEKDGYRMFMLENVMYLNYFLQARFIEV
jgi:hypothetical protein